MVYNFNIIPRELLDTFESNDCHYYFNDVMVYDNSLLCNQTWDQIQNLAGDLNWYDLFRQNYPDSALLKSTEPKNRLKSVNINGEIKTYK